MSKPWDDPSIRSATQLSQYDRRAWLAAGRPPLAFEPQPKPKPAQPAAMTPDASRTWNEWARAHTQNATDMLARIIGEECGKIENRLAKRIEAVERELGETRAAAEVERRAKIVDLPRLPLRRRDAA
jgi:hypothetical protein